MKLSFLDMAPLTVLATAVVAVVLEKLGSAVRNYGGTLAWVPNSINTCNSVEDVIEVVNNARLSGNRVKALGTGWSWNTAIAGDGDDYVILSGELADASAVEIDLDERSVIVNAGARVFPLYMALQETGFNIEAKGLCLTATESQTVGGLLATNVHHSGIKTFYDVAEWVEIVMADGKLVRTFRNETLFRLTIGGQGRTGIITRAKFDLAPRATYVFEEISEQAEDLSLRAYFAGFVAANKGYEPNESIIVGYKFPVINVPIYQGKFKVSEPKENPPAVLPPNYGDLGLLVRPLFLLDDLLDPILPPFFYSLWLPILLIASQGEQPETEGTTGQDLDVACANSKPPHIKHQELEMFVPVDLVGEVGAYLDELMVNGMFPYINENAFWVLRYVYGNDSLVAPSGVMYNGTITDVVAVNIDGYQRSMWDIYNSELQEMMAMLDLRFPQQIRLHPGKFNSPRNPDPETLEVKSLIEGFDPQGVFARDQYDGSYLVGYGGNLSNYFFKNTLLNFIFGLMQNVLSSFQRFILGIITLPPL